MNISKIWGTTTYKTTRFKLFIALMITGVLSLVLAIITFYGDNTGNFTITTRSDHQRIGLSTTPEQDQERLVLRFSGIREIGYLSYSVIKSNYLEDIKKTEGRYEGRNLIAYTFYLHNNSEIGPVDIIEYTINIDEIDQGLLEHIRVLMVIDDEEILFSLNGEDGGIPFPNQQSLGRGRIYNLVEAKKISVIFYLEVPESSNSGDMLEQGAKLKLKMAFEVLTS